MLQRAGTAQPDLPQSDRFKYIFEFNREHVDGHGRMKKMLGGKGAGLAEMCRAGLPVPPGFTISTEACVLFSRSPEHFQAILWPEVLRALDRLESISAKKFGAIADPLLLSVRSGAKFSMPGMMDTVLNIGLNDASVQHLARENADAAFAYDCYRRLLQMFGEVVLGIAGEKFDQLLAARRRKKGVRSEIELGGEELASLCDAFKRIFEQEGKVFPQQPEQQLRMAVEAVFRSWNNPRAVTYRRFNDIPEDLGTAVNVQTMVFGNRGNNSGSGVGFTRNPSTGEPSMYGEFLLRAQGEEVVAGTRTPLGLRHLERVFPDLYRELGEISSRLEKHYREMQDFEFTIDSGRLYILQTRDGKRTGLAAVRIAWDMVQEDLISREEALMRVEPEQLDQLLYPVFKESDAEVLAQGLPASPGAAVGRIAFSADDAVRMARRGEPVILVRDETTPDDIHGMEAAQGILTARGGMTSHAAVVARGMGKCCVVGCEDLHVDPTSKQLHIAGRLLSEGDFISVNGADGRVLLGEVERVELEAGTGLFFDFMGLLEGTASLGVRANADTARDTRKAREFGATGIGLCRTEHMFFAQERLGLMQQMILARDAEERSPLLERLKEFQKEDFRAILEVMDGYPVTVRLLDPPLHEFLPSREDLCSEIVRLRAAQSNPDQIAAKERVLRRVEQLAEVNPMMGHRGCRLGITYPDVTRMQVRALFEAACELKRQGRSPVVEVMIPLVSLAGELRDQADLVRETAEETLAEHRLRLPYLVGTMIEVPRAALVADQIAREAEFFSFGTNDLTQMTFGFSRDDAVKFINAYLEKGILRRDPFQTLDVAGVGELMRSAVEKGKGARPSLEIGICGEHGGDPASIQFCFDLKLDYVSCSPYRVPAARLAAARAAIRASGSGDFERIGV
ncbi:MAG: pyruvate, phosphate dikinase [Acidobacteria bacterium]|nr:pyruvate, phosphate dikinase [Acidobacteriota bacterium]